MKENKLSELTIEELNKQKNTLKGVLIGTAILMFITYGVLIFLIIQKQKFAFIAIIPCSLVALIPSVIRWNQINTELKSRLPK